MSTKLKAGTASTGAVLDADTTGILEFQTGSTPTTAVTIDASQNVGIGTTSPANKLHVVSTAAVPALISSTQATNYFQLNSAGGNSGIASNSNDLVFFTSSSGTERVRVDSSGNFLVSTTDSSQTSGVGTKIQASTTVPQAVVVHNSSSAGSTAFMLFNTNGTNNGYRFYVRTDGGIYNYSANNFNLSDQTEKHEINLANNYLDKLCQIPVKTFLFNDQNDADLNLGVIAQDVEKVCPEFITKHNIGTEENPNIKLGVYETDLKYAMLKAIQELNAKVEAQAAEIQALKGTA